LDKNNGGSIFSLCKLINHYYWRSIVNPIMTFLFPTIMLVALGFALGYYSMFPGAMWYGIIVIGVMTMPSTIADFRSSCLLKIIGISPIKTSKILFSIFIYYFLLIIVSQIFIFVLMILFFFKYIENGLVKDFSTFHMEFKSIKEILKDTSWPCYIYSVLILSITSLVTGLFVVSIFKNTSTTSSIGLMLLVLSILFSGMTIPGQIVRESNALWISSYFLTPLKPAMNMGIESWAVPVKDFQANTNIFDFSKEYEVYQFISLNAHTGNMTFLTIPEKIISFCLPFLYMSLFGFVSYKKFKWTAR